MMKLAAVLLLAAGASARERPTVSMTIGAVRGNALGDVADEFLGIPYGDAPRFEPAVVRTAPLEGTLDGSYFGPACLQVLTNVTTYGVEHGCHVLNVWRPAGAAADAALPVIMFVPGGSNDFGEAEPYNASMLASAQHAVVASINYRVGPFGFLAFEEDVGERATGNWALTDIQAALVFLRREVGAFGGDPTRLTIFGQSSGASLCNLHAVLPSSGGLLEGIVSESGGLDAGDARSALKNERVVADYLGCGNATRKACVANASGDDLVYSQDVHCFTPNDCSAATSWGPVVDGFLLPDAPARLLARSEVNDVALVLGANTNDSYLFIMNKGPVKERDYVASLREDARGDAKAFRELERRYPATADPRENSRRMGWKASDSMLCGAWRRLLVFYERDRFVFRPPAHRRGLRGGRRQGLPVPLRLLVPERRDVHGRGQLAPAGVRLHAPGRDQLRLRPAHQDEPRLHELQRTRADLRQVVPRLRLRRDGGRFRQEGGAILDELRRVRRPEHTRRLGRPRRVAPRGRGPQRRPQAHGGHEDARRAQGRRGELRRLGRHRRRRGRALSAADACRVKVPAS